MKSPIDRLRRKLMLAFALAPALPIASKSAIAATDDGIPEDIKAALAAEKPDKPPRKPHHTVRRGKVKPDEYPTGPQHEVRQLK